MKPTRRDFLALGSWMAGLPLFLPFLAKAEAGSLNPDVQNVIAFFKARDYRQVPSLDLITGDSFNDGVRYDESAPGGLQDGKTVILQRCIRMEDINIDDRPDVLPYFHILAINLKGPFPSAMGLRTMLDYLVNHLELDPARLAFVSTDFFTPYLPHLEPFGIEASQFVIRDRKAALAAGDGSGFFSPKGHPHVNPYHSVSMHYAEDPDAMQQELHHTLPGFIEIGEVMIHEDAPEVEDLQIAAIGLERISMAMGNPVESFAQSRDMALAALEAEAKRRNVPLPPAYDKLKSA
ncbi:hypothetical protein [uncultured Sneathiella sp.]|uniref:hypothetical protein n=1 Tax=uncultured Sneathiella sp. TaxID=879315 RepID=UPI0030EEE233